MASVAAQLCKHIFQNIESQSVLMIGAGMMMQEMAPYFLQRSHQSITSSSSIFLLNRSTEGIERFINQFKNQPNYQTNTWQTSDLNNIQAQLNQADIIITCTNSLQPLVTQTMLKQALKHRKHKSVVCIDLSVPRNIEIGCENLDSVYLYTVDDLGQLANAGQAHRQEATKHAIELLNHKVQDCMQWLQQQSKNSIKKAIIAHFEVLKQNQSANQIKQLNKSMHLWLMHTSQISPEQQKHLLTLLQQLH
jgi:glutamyl-tRNA reductase